MGEMKKLLARYKNERDKHYRDAADATIKAQLMDMVVIRMEDAIDREAENERAITG